MRLIQSGIVDWGPETITCSCGAIWEIEKDDLVLWEKNVGGNPRDETTKTCIGFVCGECEKQVEITAPKSLINELIRTR